MNTFVVTVTYANRFHLLDQVVEAALNEGVQKVIIVDNNSDPESKEKLQQDKYISNDKIQVIFLDGNYGSAAGFKAGIQEAYNHSECEFIWLLDDDNLPMKGALGRLVLAYQYLGGSPNNLLVSFRDRNIAQVYHGQHIQHRANSFINFHILTWLEKKIPKNFVAIKKNGINFPIIRSQVAPYGGFFFPKSVVNDIGFPNEKLFVYADDHEWTLRMTDAGYNIFLCSESLIKDIDKTWPISEGTHPHYNPATDEKKMYYSMRNNTYIDKKFITNKCIYFCNLLFVLLGNYLRAFIADPQLANKRFKIIIKAVSDGINGNFERLLK